MGKNVVFWHFDAQWNFDFGSFWFLVFNKYFFPWFGSSYETQNIIDCLIKFELYWLFNCFFFLFLKVFRVFILLIGSVLNYKFDQGWFQLSVNDRFVILWIFIISTLKLLNLLKKLANTTIQSEQIDIRNRSRDESKVSIYPKRLSCWVLQNKIKRPVFTVFLFR